MVPCSGLLDISVALNPGLLPLVRNFARERRRPGLEVAPACSEADQPLLPAGQPGRPGDGHRVPLRVPGERHHHGYPHQHEDHGAGQDQVRPGCMAVCMAMLKALCQSRAR